MPLVYMEERLQGAPGRRGRRRRAFVLPLMSEK